MGSVIVASPPVFGETVPMLELAAGLVARGHKVTTLVGSRFAERARETGARVIPLTGDADYDDRVLFGAESERNAVAPGPDQLGWDMINAFVSGMTAQYHALQALLDEDPDAALLSNSLFLGAWPVALGAPGRRPRRWVALAANPLFEGDDATTSVGPIPGLTGDEAVQAHRAANAEFHTLLEPVRTKAQEQLRALGADADAMLPYFTSLYALPDVIASLSVAEFDLPHAGAPYTLTYAGILPTVPALDPRKPDWWGELDSGRPVVVVTQGTLANSDLSMLIEPTLKALADQDVLVIAALGRDPSGLGIAVPDNARVVEYVPFSDLLPHADVLITNGGSGGTQHALAAGAPVILCGITEDKPMTGARVAYRKVGLDLRTSTPAPEQIAEAVTTVLADPSYRARARHLAQAYAAHDPVTIMESLLR